LCFTEGARTTDEVVKKIEQVFTDDKSSAGIRLSSVHRAKGLEARRVFILVPKESPMPHPLAKSSWEKEQELNLKYVAITRAIEELVWVS
jgi:superfamily I DNA/RNA helicase